MDRREYASNLRSSWESFIDDNPGIHTQMIVCPSCDGKGSYVNPSIDSHGISSDDECWLDDEFSDNYRSGYYDITCEYCGGNNVVPVPSDQNVAKEWENYQQEVFYSYSESYNESRQLGYY